MMGSFCRYFSWALMSVLIVAPVGAVTVTTTGSGNWSNTAVNAPWPSGVPAAGSDIVIASGHSVTITVAVAASPNNLTIQSGGQLTVGGYNLTVGGATEVSGTLWHTNASGTHTFTGPVTIFSGGVWNESAGPAISFAGNLQNDGTFTAGTGIHTFSGSGKAFSGTSGLVISNLTLSGTYTNNGTLSVSNALAGSGTLTQGASASSILNYGGSSITPTLVASNSGNTVRYTGAAQTVKPTTYNNLTLAGSGAKTIVTATVIINGTLSMEGTATASLVPTYGPAATLQYNTATGRNAGPEWKTPFVATGGVLITNTGVMTQDVAKVFSNAVPLAIRGGATLASGNYKLTLGGVFTNDGNFVAGTGTVEWNATNAQNIATGAYYNVILSGSGAKSLFANTTVGNNLSIAPTGSTATALVEAGINLVGINSLTLGSLSRINGTWGSTSAASATYQNDTFFSPSTGYLTVTTDTRTTPLFTAWPTAGTIITGQMLSASALIGGSATNAMGMSVAGVFAFTSPTTIPPAGPYSASVTFTPADATSYLTANNNVTVPVASLNIYYVVPTNPLSASPFNAWTNAATNIQAAVDRAAIDVIPGTVECVVLVTNGLYTITNTLRVATNIYLRSVNGAEATVVRRFTNANYRVAIVSNAAAVVEGFTFFNGYDTSGRGGGIYLGAGTLRSCIVVSNLSSAGAGASASGGGIYMTGGLVEDCLFLTNAAYSSPNYPNASSGGGIYMTGGFVRRCKFFANRTDSGYSLQGGNGGAIYMTGGTSENCVAINNSAPGAGGALYVSGAGTRAWHWTAVSNTTWSTNGGGLYLASGAVSNSIVYFNRRNIDGLPHNVTQIGGALGYSCTWPLNAGTGNISGDPGFAVITPSNCVLSAGSPCIDAGATLPGVTNDIDKVVRPVDGDDNGLAAPDMGAWEAPSGTGGLFRCNFTTAVDRAIDSLTAVLIAQVAGPATNGLYYWWDYQNDGTNDAEGFNCPIVTNTYGPGKYSVKLTVSNSAGTVTSLVKVDYLLVSPSITYVWLGGGNQYPYETWTKAATTVVPAINAVADPGTVLITNGTYSWGGIPYVSGAQTVRGVNGATSTIVTGDYRVTINHSDALLEGVSVFAGKGIYLINGTVRACNIASNFNTRADVGTSYGGGVRMAAGRLENCHIWSNRTYDTANASCYGGAVALFGGTVEDCLIETNYAHANSTYTGVGYGGGIYMTGGFVRRCRFVGNKTDSAVSYLDGRGGAIYMTGGTSENCLALGNSAPKGGGGLYLTGGRAFYWTIVSNTTWNLGGGGLYQIGGAMSNSIIYYNIKNIDGNPDNVVQTNGSLDYSCTTPDHPGTGNISGEPGFASISPNSCTLLGGSPCIDTAVTIPGITNDIDKTIRPLDGNDDSVETPDRGAWEAQVGLVFQCNFTANVEQATDSLEAVLTAEVSGPNTNGLYYWWDYQNDGTNDAEGFGLRTVTNTYGPGKYSVKLTVSNAAAAVIFLIKTDYLWVTPSTTYVALTGGHVYPYDTWGKAATTVVAAINAADESGTVLITNGVFRWGGSPSISFAQTVRGVNGAASTIVTGDYRLVINHSNAVLEGLSIVNTKGIYLQNGTIRACNIASNYNYSADVDGCNGGGVRMSAGLLENCRIWHNRVFNTANGYSYGGGVFILGGMVRNCLIVGNMATVGGIYSYTGKGLGGGVYLGGNGSVVNCTISGNVVNDTGAEGGGLYIAAGASVVTNTIVWKNCNPGETDIFTELSPRNDYGGSYTTKVVYSCGMELATGAGNLTNDPLFVITGTGYGTNLVVGDYHLMELSPCLNAGTNHLWMRTARDLDGNFRILRQRVDMGAYEALPQAGSIFFIN